MFGKYFNCEIERLNPLISFSEVSGSNKIKEIYFTGMFTNASQTDFYIQYILKAWKKRQKNLVFAESCGVVRRSRTNFLCSFGAEKVKV